MKVIALSFTLKGQDLKDIKNVVEMISNQFGGRTGKIVLAHGFMPKDVILEKGFSTELNSMLKEYFPLQIHFYKEGDLTEMRKNMCVFLKENKGEAMFIGEIKDGVKEEFELYQANGVTMQSFGLDFGNNWTNPPLTFGQKAVGITFNPGGHPQVNKIKEACAAVIDELAEQREEAKKDNNGEKIAQYTLAIRDIQSGQMWGVKAATWQY